MKIIIKLRFIFDSQILFLKAFKLYIETRIHFLKFLGGYLFCFAT